MIKIYRPKNLIDIEGEYQFRNEFKKVFGCHHENIISPTNFSIFEESPYLVLPYCPSGSSELYIGTLTKKEDLIKYIFEVASGLAYLHEHSPQIVHQDIKPANVLIDDNGNYAITDFGISASMGGADAEANDETGGTFAYMAPERFEEGAIPMPESDIWALGATIYEIIAGDTPFGNDGGSLQNVDTQIPPLPQPVAEDIKNLVYACLAFDPAKRPTARDIVDSLLKKRYSRNKKATWVFSIAGITVIAAIIVFGVLYKPYDTTSQLDVLNTRADSIINAQITFLNENLTDANEKNIQDLEVSRQILTNLISDAPEDYLNKKDLGVKEKNITELMNELQLYLRNQDLANKALRTELEEEYQTFSLQADMHKRNILNLINQFQ